MWNWLWGVQGREEQKLRGACTNDKAEIHIQGGFSVTARVSPRVGGGPLLSFTGDKTKGLELKPEEFKLENKNLLVVRPGD